MANAFMGNFPIEVGAETFVLCLDFNAMCLLEDRYDMPVLKIAAKLQEEERFSDVRAFIWAALQQFHPTVSEEGAGAIVQAYGVAKIIALLPKIIAASFPKAEAGKPKPGPRKAAASRSELTSTNS